MHSAGYVIGKILILNHSKICMGHARLEKYKIRDRFELKRDYQEDSMEVLKERVKDMNASYVRFERDEIDEEGTYKMRLDKVYLFLLNRTTKDILPKGQTLVVDKTDKGIVKIVSVESDEVKVFVLELKSVELERARKSKRANTFCFGRNFR